MLREELEAASGAIVVGEISRAEKAIGFANARRMLQFFRDSIAPLGLSLPDSINELARQYPDHYGIVITDDPLLPR